MIPRGLYRQGNRCYIIAAIQQLFNLEDLMNTLISSNSMVIEQINKFNL